MLEVYSYLNTEINSYDIRMRNLQIKIVIRRMKINKNKRIIEIEACSNYNVLKINSIPSRYIKIMRSIIS